MRLFKHTSKLVSMIAVVVAAQSHNLIAQSNAPHTTDGQGTSSPGTVILLPNPPGNVLPTAPWVPGLQSPNGGVITITPYGISGSPRVLDSLHTYPGIRPLDPRFPLANGTTLRGTCGKPCAELSPDQVLFETLNHSDPRIRQQILDEYISQSLTLTNSPEIATKYPIKNPRQLALWREVARCNVCRDRLQRIIESFGLRPPPNVCSRRSAGGSMTLVTTGAILTEPHYWVYGDAGPGMQVIADLGNAAEDTGELSGEVAVSVLSGIENVTTTEHTHPWYHWPIIFLGGESIANNTVVVDGYYDYYLSLLPGVEWDSSEHTQVLGIGQLHGLGGPPPRTIGGR